MTLADAITALIYVGLVVAPAIAAASIQDGTAPENKPHKSPQTRRRK